MASEPITEAELETVLGGNGTEGNPPAGPICTPDDPQGVRGGRPPQYWENSPPGSHGGGGHGGGGGHQPHLDPPVRIRQPPPWRPTIIRSDRRLKRRIRAV